MNDVRDDNYDLAERYAIVVAAGAKPRILDEVQQAIRDDLYYRDRSLVIVRFHEQDCTLTPLSREALDYLINTRCHFEKHVVSRRNGEVTTVPLDAPRYVAETIHGLGDWPLFREVRQVTAVPFLRPDGSVGGLRPGYDPLSKVYANVPEGLQAPPDRPSDEQAREALRSIRDIVDEFPFASDACESVLVAAILTIVARRYLRDAVPLFIVEASKSGSGKTLLARIIATIGTGADPGLAGSGGNDTEFRKTITSFLLSGQAVLVLDNQTGRLGGQVLDRLQTAGKWSDRLLNLNQQVNLNNDIVTIVTSNNTIVEGDTGRRSLVVRLVPNCERPEYRNFRSKHLLRDVHRRRHELALAAITILRWHIVRGCPEMPAPVLGSFETWSTLVRQAVMNLGMPDPVETQSGIQELDEQHLVEKQFVLAFAAWKHSWVGTAEELVAAVSSSQEASDLKAAMAKLCGHEAFDASEITTTKLGYKLRAIKDRRFDKWAIVHAGIARKGIRWGLRCSEACGDAAMDAKPLAPSPQA